MINKLLREIQSHGSRGAVVPFSRISDLKKDMVDLTNGNFHPSWLDRMANHITGNANKFMPVDLNFEPRSLISIITPSPKVLLEFTYRGKVIHCVVPPHYTDWESKNKEALQYIQNYLTPRGFSAAMAVTLPQKMLAVHCGLARYGRNNICYNDEFGSYMQIMTYISDLPCDENKWFPIGRMEMCDNCRACVASCPTGAIDANRQLINSDKCITLIDESPGDFPEWLDKEAHNSIVGCTKCQDCCPGNAHNKNNIITGVAFTEQETTELVDNNGDTPYSDTLAVKIKSTGIPPEYTDNNVLPRNFRALLQKTTLFEEI